MSLIRPDEILNLDDAPCILFSDRRHRDPINMEFLPLPIRQFLSHRSTDFYVAINRWKRIQLPEIEGGRWVATSKLDHLVKFINEEGGYALVEYRFDGVNFTPIMQWPAPTTSRYVYPVGDIGYYVIYSTLGKYVFYLRDEPLRTLTYRFEEINNHLAQRYGVSQTSLLDVSWVDWRYIDSLLVLGRDGSATPPDLLLIELQPEAIKEEKPSELFKLVASIPQRTGESGPFTILGADDVLVLSNPQLLVTMAIINPRELSYLKRGAVNEDGLRPFGEEQHPIPLPEGEIAISRFPYDDEHLLVFRENAFWTMKYDTGELTQLFPQ